MRRSYCVCKFSQDCASPRSTGRALGELAFTPKPTAVPRVYCWSADADRTKVPCARTRISGTPTTRGLSPRCWVLTWDDSLPRRKSALAARVTWACNTQPYCCCVRKREARWETVEAFPCVVRRSLGYDPKDFSEINYLGLLLSKMSRTVKVSDHDASTTFSKFRDSVRIRAPRITRLPDMRRRRSIALSSAAKMRGHL